MAHSALHIDALGEAVIAGASADELVACPTPRSTVGACLRREDEAIFADGGVADIRRSIHVDEVELPALEPDEVLVAVMASAINYNTVWSATFRPMSTFAFLDRFGETGPAGARHSIDRHVLGSDASGVVVRTGSAVRHWSIGDQVVINTLHTDEQDPMAQWDGMLPNEQRAWGYETNFGGLATYTVVKATQLLRKPAHLTWEEAASYTLCLMTAYRMLISRNGVAMKLGDIVLVWGATGGLGAFAVQLVQAAGGRVVGVVGGSERVELATRMGCDLVIDRTEVGDGPEGMRSPRAWKRIGARVREAFGEDVHHVFEHVGRETFGASVYLARRGGSVVTCGSSTGFAHEYDNRLLWMRMKRIIGSHGANYQESWEANRLVELGVIAPTLSTVHPLVDVAEAACSVQLNEHAGKVGVLCLAPEPGTGVSNPQRRAELGEDRLTLFRPRAAVR